MLGEPDVLVDSWVWLTTQDAEIPNDSLSPDSAVMLLRGDRRRLKSVWLRSSSRVKLESLD